MENQTPIQDPTPQDSLDAERQVAELTKMSAEASRTYMDFHTGMRWLRRDRE